MMWEFGGKRERKTWLQPSSWLTCCSMYIFHPHSFSGKEAAIIKGTERKRGGGEQNAS